MPLLEVGAIQLKTAEALPPIAIKSRGTLGAIGTGADHADFVYTNKLTEPKPALLIASGVANVINFSLTAAGDIVESDSRSNAAAPATCGDAIDVPDNERIALDEENQDETMLEPGAKISKQLP